jgi:dGTPase
LDYTTEMLRTREELERIEAETLAPYAMKNKDTAGRVHKEPHDPYRLPYQRDYARIIHCRSFRRLQAKTQVFISNYGDHYRDRMTHSIEVAQLAKDTSRTLGLNEDLVQCIALAHDLGHTPFGHGGEDALNEVMTKFGEKFEHNEQSRRILEKLEKVFAGFDGLNLSKEVLDGLIKHNPHLYEKHSNFITSPHLEAQMADFADEVAYTNHDLDDGLRSGLIKIEDIKDFQIWKEAEEEAVKIYGKEILHYDRANRRRYFSRVISKIINIMINDLQQTAEKNIRENNIDSVDKVRKHEGRLIHFSKSMKEKYTQLRTFLMNDFYYHHQVDSEIQRGKKIIKDLFEYYYSKPEKLPKKYTSLIETGEELHFVVKDYVAGMTDSFAQTSWEKLNSKE